MKNNRGWIVWSISRIGVMMAVLLITLMVFMIYRYSTCVSASDGANQVAEGLSRTIMNVYAGPVGIETTYRLPAKIGSQEYGLNIINADKEGVLINVPGTRCGMAKGGASFRAHLESYPEPVKNATEENVTLVIRNREDGVYIGRMDKCSGCIAIDEFHYDAGDDCDNLNGEYVRFRNTCDAQCNLAGWTVKDKIDDRPEYTFPSFVLNSGSTVTLYTGCGTDTTSEVYWCSNGYPCNAVWNNDGDTLYLRESNGFLCLEYTYPQPT